MSNQIIYDTKYHIDIPFQWSGTNLPCFIILFFIKIYYNFLYFIIFKIIQIRRSIQNNIIYNNSNEYEALYIYIKLHKPLITSNIDAIRMPFFAIILPPIYPFILKIIKLNNIKMYQIKSFNTSNRYVDNKKIILYIHGGGFVSGDFAGFKGFLSNISNLLSYPVYFPQYRLAPEYSLEDMLDDCYKAYMYVSNKYEEVILMGDSAGGFLCFLLLNKIYKSYKRQPYKVVLFSPLIDLDCNKLSYEINKDLDPILHPIIIKEVIKTVPMQIKYKINPNKYYPPMIIFIGKNEIIVDDSIHYVKEAMKLGLNIELIIEDVFHTWQCFEIPESEKTLSYMVEFLCKK